MDAALARPGTTLLVVNSICGCAAGKMRPGVRLALANTANKPDQSITVFAGQDREATERARSHFDGNPPTSPAIAIFRDGKLAYLMQRYMIENSTPQAISSTGCVSSAKASPKAMMATQAPEMIHLRSKRSAKLAASSGAIG